MHGNYAQAAQLLGLSMTPRSASLFTSVVQLDGQVDGQYVRICRLIGMHTLDTEVFFSPALDLGLDLTPAGQLPYPGPLELRAIGRLFAKLRKDIEVGEKKFDDAFTIHGDEPARVVELIAPLHTQLLEWHASEANFTVTDSGVRLRRYSMTPFTDDVDFITGDLRPAVAFARAFQEAAAKLPAATALAPHLPAFRAFAAEHGFPLRETPLATWGTLSNGRAMHALCTRTGHEKFAVQTSITFPAALPAPVRVQPRKSVSKQLVTTGDAAFDAAFAVAEPTMLDRLPLEARAILLELAKAGHTVQVSERGATLHAELGKDAYRLAAHAGALGDALDMIERSFVPQAGYR